MRAARPLIAAIALACSHRVSLYCDETHACAESATHPYCDLRGVHPESDGVARTCVTTPLACTAGTACESRDDGAGVCRDAPTGSSWCTFVDPTCPAGERWSTLAGDGLAGMCVGAEGVADGGGVDSGPVDANPVDSIPPDAPLYEAMTYLVSGLTFEMGCSPGTDPDCASDEGPVHSVTLSPFLIDTFEVCQARYNQCVRDGVCTPPSADYDPFALPDRPVRSVTWAQASEYCAWAGRRLPTEAEWEGVARREGALYPWGVGVLPCSDANFASCLGEPWWVSATLPDHGLVVNQGGNVEEWVGDWYSPSYYTTSPSVDPQGPATGTMRAIRGGHYDSLLPDLRNAARNAATPSDSSPTRGFRCAKDPPPP